MDSTSSNSRIELSTEDVQVPAISAEFLADTCEAFWKGEDFEIVERDSSYRRGERRKKGRVEWFKVDASKGASETILKLSVGSEFFGGDDVGGLAASLNEVRHRCLRFINLRVTEIRPVPKIYPAFATSSLSISELPTIRWTTDTEDSDDEGAGD